ncbi:MAG: hypothetical protein ACOCV4_03260 [Myxococcota bacterium]
MRARPGRAVASLALVATLVAGAAKAQEDEPPPWESGEVDEEVPPWESGAPVPPEDEPPAGEGDAEAPDVELEPPGEDSERPPYQSDTATMGSTRAGDLGIEQRQEDDTSWTAIPFDARGPVAYGAVGFEEGNDLGHLVLSAGAGWTVWGEWTALRAEGETPRLEGTATNLFLTVDAAPAVTDDADTSWITIGARAQQVVAFGRHLLSAQLGVGGRKDLDTDLGGVDLVFGVGYAYGTPPFAIPVQLELVRHFSGVFPRNQWGVRLSVGWPLWFNF